MSVCTRLFCASLLLCWGSVTGEVLNFTPHQTVHYEGRCSLQSEWLFNKEPMNLIAVQNLKGTLALTGFQEQEEKFPVPMQFMLEELQFLLHEGDKVALHTLELPQHMTALNQLKPWKKRPLAFSVTDRYPFISYPEHFLRKYGGLKVFREPILAGFFGEELYTLFELAGRPLVAGEGFEWAYDKEEQQPFQKKKIVVIQAITPTHVVAEVTSLIERQKLSFLGVEQAVVDGQAKAIYTINRASGLLFDITETAVITQSLRIQGVEATLKHTLKKQIKTSPIHEMGY